MNARHPWFENLYDHKNISTYSTMSIAVTEKAGCSCAVP